jgi:hypothetical protein
MVRGFTGRIPVSTLRLPLYPRTFYSMMSDWTIGAEVSADDRRLLMRQPDQKTTSATRRWTRRRGLAAIARIDGKTPLCPLQKPYKKTGLPAG